MPSKSSHGTIEQFIIVCTAVNATLIMNSATASQDTVMIKAQVPSMPFSSRFIRFKSPPSARSGLCIMVWINQIDVLAFGRHLPTFSSTGTYHPMSLTQSGTLILPRPANRFYHSKRSNDSHLQRKVQATRGQKQVLISIFNAQR